MADAPDDERLLEIAGAISDGTAINWADERERTAPLEGPILDELQTLEILARLGEATPATWGPFEILGEVGSGAFGTVYRARNRELEIDVALKVIGRANRDLAFDPERALGEARRLAKVNHTNVVRVFDAERHNDEVGVWMEFVDGSTLDELVRLQGTFDAREAALIGVDLCRALSAVHAAGALHGDVKAHNVMRARGGRIVLMDFGTSRDLAGPVDAAVGDFAGTPIYMAPEVFGGAPRSRASDIYSLGVLMFYLTTGTYPVDGDTRSQLGARHRNEAPLKALRDVRPDLPEWFVRTVERALARQPGDRYGSAAQFEEALGRSHRFTRRTMLIAGAGLAAAAALAVVALPGGRTLWNTVTGQSGAYQVDAALYRYRPDGSEVRLRSGDRVSRGDQVSLQIRTSVPAYVYVVSEDDHGASFLLYPLPGQALSNPLIPATTHRLPGQVNGKTVAWQVTTAGEREHFFLFVSPKPSPDFERFFERLPQPASAPAASAARLSSADLEILRGVGGLAPAPVPSSVKMVDAQLRHVPEFSSPLGEQTETVRGVWVREASFANPE